MKHIRKMTAVILALTLCFSLSACGNIAAKPTALATAVYPETVKRPNEEDYVTASGNIGDAFFEAYDAWNKDVQARRDLADYDADSLAEFFKSSMAEFLSHADGENRVYSPLNVYMALGMLGEITDGESRAQILSLLGADDISSLRAQANSIWNAHYQDDGVTTSVLASSLWLDETVDTEMPALKTLAENYYASSYQGKMGSKSLNRALQNWLNAQTGGLLQEEASSLELDAQTLLAIAATINFHAKWYEPFLQSHTSEGVFHGADQDIACDFMHQNDPGTFYRGTNFSAVSKAMENDGQMWFILPDENTSIDALLKDGSAVDFLLSNKDAWEDQAFYTVCLSVPKFDVKSDLDLISGLKALGITDVFDPAISDFSPLAREEALFVSRAQHAARVTIDEEGCTAVAFTVMDIDVAGVNVEKEIDFTLDRPFLFAITGADGLPLFAGEVNRPV